MLFEQYLSHIVYALCLKEINDIVANFCNKTHLLKTTEIIQEDIQIGYEKLHRNK